MLTRNSRIYYISQLLHSLIFTIPIWVVYYQARISIEQISFIVTFQYITQMILEMPSGALADMIGRRNTIVIAFFVGALSFLLFPLAQNIFHFILLAFLAGMSDSFRSGSEEAIVYDTYKEADKEDSFTKAYSNGNMIYQFGLITASALGGFLYVFNNYLPFILYGTALLLGSILTFFYIEPKIDSVKFTVKNYLLQIKNGSREVFHTNYSTSISLFYVFVGGIAWSSTLYFNDYMLIDLGFSDSTRGYISAFVRLINTIIIAKLLVNQKLFNKTRTILFFPIVMLIAYLPGFILNGYAGIPFIQLAMMVTSARWIILAPLTNAVFSSKYRATAISFLSLLIGVVYVGLTSISGIVINDYGVGTMYTLLGIFSLITVVPLSIKLIRANH